MDVVSVPVIPQPDNVQITLTLKEAQELHEFFNKVADYRFSNPSAPSVGGKVWSLWVALNPFVNPNYIVDVGRDEDYNDDPPF